MGQYPSIGRIVHYGIETQSGAGPVAWNAAIIVRVHNATCVNLKVFEDNYGTIPFKTSVCLGEGAGEWRWPPRVADVPVTEKEPARLVFLNGSQVYVPATVDCHYAARGALGIAGGFGVGREIAETGKPDGFLAFQGGHSFEEGDRYVSFCTGPVSPGDGS